MSELQIPRLRDAQRATRELRRRDDLADVILQGVARDGGSIIQAMCLRQTNLNPERRWFETFEMDKPELGGGKLTAIKTVTEGGSWYSMVSRRFTTSPFLSGIKHVMSTGRRAYKITDALVKPGTSQSLSSIGKLTGPEDGVTQLVGIADLGIDTQARGINQYNYRLKLLADRALARRTELPVGEVDVRIPINSPYDELFRQAGRHGVAHVLFNTVNNGDGDYANQPGLVSIGKNPRANSLEAVAEHLAYVFDPAAIAVRQIDRDDPTMVEQFVWNDGQ